MQQQLIIFLNFLTYSLCATTINYFLKFFNLFLKESDLYWRLIFLKKKFLRYLLFLVVSWNDFYWHKLVYIGISWFSCADLSPVSCVYCCRRMQYDAVRLFFVRGCAIFIELDIIRVLHITRTPCCIAEMSLKRKLPVVGVCDFCGIIPRLA